MANPHHFMPVSRIDYAKFYEDNKAAINEASKTPGDGKEIAGAIEFGKRGKQWQRLYTLYNKYKQNKAYYELHKQDIEELMKGYEGYALRVHKENGEWDHLRQSYERKLQSNEREAKEKEKHEEKVEQNRFHLLQANPFKRSTALSHNKIAELTGSSRKKRQAKRQTKRQARRKTRRVKK